MQPDSRPHIIVVTTAFTPFLGGAEIAMQEIIKRLGSQFRFTVVTARLKKTVPKHDQWADARVIRVGWGCAFDKIFLIFATPFIVARLKKTESAKLVWAVMASYAGAGAYLARIFSGVPFVLTLQEGDDLKTIERRVGPAMPLFRKIFVHAAGIQVIAPFLADWAQKLGARANPITVPNGVNPELFAMNSEERAIYRKKIRSDLAIPEQAPVVLTISRLVPKNGVATLIDAVAKTPHHHAIIIGDGSLRSELEARATTAGARDRVHFVGFQEQNQLSRFAAASDIFSRPAVSEGQGIAFLEAMCMGLPIIATRVGGIPSVIIDGENGILIEPNDAAALAQTLLALTPGNERCEQLASHGREHVKKYSWDVLVPRIEQWLQTCLEQSSQI